MDERIEKELRQIVMELSGITRRLAKIADMDDEIVDILEEKDVEKEMLEKVEKAIEKVNEKEKQICKIAKVIMVDEPNIYSRDEAKVVVVLKAIAVSKLAGISEFRLSVLLKRHPDLVKKLGNVKIRNFYHAMKYTSLWRYRNVVYSLFGIRVEENDENVRCTYCGGDDVIKVGSRQTAKRGRKQRYYCKSCNRSFVPERDKEFVEYKKEYKYKAGMLYCDLNSNLLLKDIVKMMRNDYGINVSTATVSNWVNDYIYENLGKLTQAQKKWIVIKKVIELDGWEIDDIVKLIKSKWGYKVTHIKMIDLVSSYRKIKENDKKIKEMIDNGVKLNAIAEYLGVPKDMIKLLYGRGENGK